MRTFKNFSLLKKEYKLILSSIFLIIFFTNGVVQAQNWSALGSGCNARTRALTVYNGQLIVGGDFTKLEENRINKATAPEKIQAVLKDIPLIRRKKT